MRDLQGIRYDNHKRMAQHLKQRPNAGNIINAFMESRQFVGEAVAERAEEAAGIKVVDLGDGKFHYEELV